MRARNTSRVFLSGGGALARRTCQVGRSPRRSRGSGALVALGTILAMLWMALPLAQEQQEPERLRDGAPLWYSQRPRLVRADDAGGVALDRLLVAGDVETLTFERESESARDDVVETWPRTGTTAIDGRLVSVFNLSWSHAELWDAIRREEHGFDKPMVSFGRLKIRTNNGDEFSNRIRLNMAPLNVPKSRVERIDDTTQYASHVVNLVIPGFGNGRLTDYGDYRLDMAARRFYEHFADEYDSIAFVAAETTVADYKAFARRVRQPVSGLGRSLFDRSAEYGSAGILRTVEVYEGAVFATMETSHHEIGHTWVDDWDWSALTGGVELYDQTSHTPLLYPGEVFTGVLYPYVRVARTEDGEGFVLEHTPAPAALHPTTLYRMGLIGPESVPDLLLFENQRQGLRVGDRIDGGVRRVHINDIMAEHGRRSGPVDSTWRRATVIVSRDELLSQAEMDFWNFFAARHAATEGVTTSKGVPSWYEATGGRARLHTDITPKTRVKIVNEPPLRVSHVPIDPGEFRGVRLDEPVPGLITPGRRLTISGSVTTTARDDFDEACVEWRRRELSPRDFARTCTDVVGNRFRMTTTLQEHEAGHYALLFWLDSPRPDAGRVHLASISGITVGFNTSGPTPDGGCVVGLELSPGQFCAVDIPGVSVGSNRFEVRSDGRGCYGASICAGNSLNLNGFRASRISGTNRWRIDALP